MMKMNNRNRKRSRLLCDDYKARLPSTVQQHNMLDHEHGQTAAPKRRRPLPSSAAASPSTLRSLCVDLVACNLQNVASFRGFPDEIAGELLHRAQTLGQLDTVDQCEPVFRLFAQSYGAGQCNSTKGQQTGVNLLSHLNCSRSPLLLVRKRWHCISLLSDHITALDLSHCGITDSHPILSEIGRMRNLDSLNLNDNHLSALGIRELTLTTRVTGRGPNRLRTLDLSCNTRLNDEALKYVTGAFGQLDRLNMTNTKTGVHQSIVHRIRPVSPSPVIVRPPKKPVVIKTTGLFAPLIEAWKRTSTAATERSTKQTNAHSFYGSYVPIVRPPPVKPAAKPAAPAAVAALTVFTNNTVKTAARKSPAPGFVPNAPNNTQTDRHITGDGQRDGSLSYTKPMVFVAPVADVNTNTNQLNAVADYKPKSPPITNRPPHRTSGLSPSYYQVPSPGKNIGSEWMGLPKLGDTHVNVNMKDLSPTPPTNLLSIYTPAVPTTTATLLKV